METTTSTKTSSARAAASRANGAKSKGPTSARGKAISSQNAIRHGLLANTVVLKEEPPQAFIGLLEELFEVHSPRNGTEMILVERMASAHWRLLRTWSMQKHALDAGLAAQAQSGGSPGVRAARAFQDSYSCSYELLLRYEIALDRQYHRALHRLEKLQSKSPVAKQTQEVIDEEEIEAVEDAVEIHEPESAPQKTTSVPNLQTDPLDATAPNKVEARFPHKFKPVKR